MDVIDHNRIRAPLIDKMADEQASVFKLVVSATSGQIFR